MPESQSDEPAAGILSAIIFSTIQLVLSADEFAFAAIHAKSAFQPEQTAVCILTVAGIHPGSVDARPFLAEAIQRLEIGRKA